MSEPSQYLSPPSGETKVKSKDTPPRYVMLCGLPATGKTSFRKSALEFEDYPWVHLSSDDEIEQLCEAAGLTYTQGFLEHAPTAAKIVNEKRAKAIKSGNSIIDDHTNLTIGSRRKKLATVPKAYLKQLYYFGTPSKEEHLRRLARRPEKVIPAAVIEKMAASYEVPTRSEGFDMITFFDDDYNIVLVDK